MGTRKCIVMMVPLWVLIPLWALVALFVIQIYWETSTVTDMKKESREMRQEIQQLRREIQKTRDGFLPFTGIAGR